MARRTLIVAGAGIAGLATARALSQAGFRVIVLERAAGPAREGAGVQLSPNACHVLRRLGALRALAAGSLAPDRIVLRRAGDGALLSRFDLGEAIRERHGAPYLVAERAVLRDALLGVCRGDTDIDVRFGEGVADLALHRNGVTVLTDAGRETVGAGLVGADGVHSQVRGFVRNGGEAAATGWTAWRATGPLEEAMRAETTAWLDSAAHLVHYPMPGLGRLNMVAVLPESDRPPLERFDEWSPVIRTLVRKAEGWAPWTIRTVSPGDWAYRAIALVGDAAHAMPPYAAQGAAMALEDAAVLAWCAARARDDLAAAWVAYADRRRPRIRAVAVMTNANRRIYHMTRPWGLFRDLSMRVAPQVVLQRRMDDVYGWTPPPGPAPA